MKPEPPGPDNVPIPPHTSTGTVDLHILADGTIHARNLTPLVARLLAELNPHDAVFRHRATATALGAGPWPGHTQTPGLDTPGPASPTCPPAIPPPHCP